MLCLVTLIDNTNIEEIYLAAKKTEKKTDLRHVKNELFGGEDYFL